MNAKKLLEEMTTPISEDAGRLLNNPSLEVRVYPILGYSSNGLADPYTMVQRQMVVDGKRFVVQVMEIT